MRRASRVDANQPEIIRALRDAGCFIQPLNAVGDGCPDLLVGIAGKTILMEIKDGLKPPSARMLTDDQREWHACWRGGTLCIVNDVEAALRVVNVALAAGSHL